MPAVYKSGSSRGRKRLPDDGRKPFGSMGRMSDECRPVGMVVENRCMRCSSQIPPGAIYCTFHLNYTPIYRED